MRKWALVLMLILAVGAAGVALAAPPDEDPTCTNPRTGEPSRAGCAGDNGDEGCQGINVAEEHVPEEAGDAMDLVTDILGEGVEDECDSGNSNARGR